MLLLLRLTRSVANTQIVPAFDELRAAALRRRANTRFSLLSGMLLVAGFQDCRVGSPGGFSPLKYRLHIAFA